MNWNTSVTDMNSGLFALGSRLYFLTIFSRKYRAPVIIFVMRRRRGRIAVSKETSTSETICRNIKFYTKIRWFKGMQYCFSSKAILQNQKFEELRSEEWLAMWLQYCKSDVNVLLDSQKLMEYKFSGNNLVAISQK